MNACFVKLQKKVQMCAIYAGSSKKNRYRQKPVDKNQFGNPLKFLLITIQIIMFQRQNELMFHKIAKSAGVLHLC